MQSSLAIRLGAIRVVVAAAAPALATVRIRTITITAATGYSSVCYWTATRVRENIARDLLLREFVWANAAAAISSVSATEDTRHCQGPRKARANKAKFT